MNDDHRRFPAPYPGDPHPTGNAQPTPGPAPTPSAYPQQQPYAQGLQTPTHQPAPQYYAQTPHAQTPHVQTHQHNAYAQSNEAYAQTPPQHSGHAQWGPAQHQAYGQPALHQPTFGVPQIPNASSQPSAEEEEEDTSWSREVLAAILYGHGFTNPRKRGRDFLAFSAIALVFNLVLIFVFNSYYVLLALLPGLLFPGGLWLVVVGAPGRSADGRPAAMWSRLGFALSLLAGLPLCWLLLIFFHGG